MQFPLKNRENRKHCLSINVVYEIGDPEKEYSKPGRSG
jgi:hypothetical protein